MSSRQQLGQDEAEKRTAQQRLLTDIQCWLRSRDVQVFEEDGAEGLVGGKDKQTTGEHT